jgi:MSHA biogenesis protein MshG
MPYFTYTARDGKGDLVEGAMESPTATLLADYLARSGSIPIDIEESLPPERTALAQLRNFLPGAKVTTTDVMMFSRQMYTLLKAGVPMARALAGLQESAAHSVFGLLVKNLRELLDSGRELSQALATHAKVFDSFYVAMVRVGEQTGRLEEIFLDLYEHVSFQKFMRDQVKSALRYPMFVVAAMAIALVVINVFVIPTFAKVFKGYHAELPLMTKLLIAFSDFMVATWPAMVGAVIAAVVASRAILRTAVGRYAWDRWKLRIPVAGKIMLKATLARFARSFALAQKSGVPVVQGLNLVAQVVENDYIGRKLVTMRAGVERGESILRTATNTGVFTPVVLQMIMVGEESGSLDVLMQEVADYYERDVEHELKTLAAQIEPILIVFLGVIVLILALGVFLPMWDFGKAAIKH